MRGDNHLFAVTTTADEVTGEIKPLFAFPVQVCKATETRKSPFDIAAPSGAPRRQVYIDEATGELVEDADCPRGVRVGDEFRPIPDEAITEVKGQKTNMMVALGSLPLDDVDFRRAEDIYFVQTPAKGGSAKAYRIVYEALRAVRGKGGKIVEPARAIVTKRTPRTNETLCVVYADEQHGCLMMVKLRFTADLRQPDEQVLAPGQVEVEAKAVETARKVIAGLGDGATVIETECDENIARQTELIEKAFAGEAITAPTPIAVTVETDDILGALEASLA